MQVYADPEFVRGLSRLHSEEREAVENCLYKLKNRNWDVGLRVKRLKGFPKRVWEARVNRADRLLFLIAPATHESTGATDSLYVLDYVGHDHVTRVRRRDLSASSYLSLVLEQAQQPENVEEEFDNCTSEQLEEWTHEEARSGAATEYLRAYAQRFVATAEEIESLPDTERELWLTEEQMAVVTTAGHCVVSGTAGSGKTTIAVQRLLADTGSSQPKLYLAYNPWLVDYARELFQRLLPEEEREALKDVVHFKTVQQLTREYLGSALENFPEDGEVRFADFQLPYQAWNKQIPAATAWSEIRSIIKGACLDPKRDLLDLKEYRELGKSRSAYLHQDREVIHKLAQQYQKWLKERKRYDEIDLSRQAVRQILSQRPAGYSTIVCDEVQDLTELQLEFIFLLNSKDGSLFFTGDLNQIINPSGFRWEEVNSHFYRRKQQKPERQHLSYNFRSVGSIVKLADAILRLRGRLIGGNSEPQKDHHLQEGQKPRLISSSDEAAVKSLVAGLVGQYAVLVRTEAQRNRLKTETGSPFVFTIEEAKGLEFDRTLVWDFFRDQQSLWRKALGGTLAAKDSPALRHELNLLYVAATRPRRWLYFYDAHTTIWAEAELNGAFDYAVPESLAEEGEARLTPEQWSQQGKYYLDRDFFEQARFCFEQAEDSTSARRVNAKMLEHKKKWGEAGEEYFELQDFSTAASLLEKGGEWQRASEAYQQAGDAQEALRCDAQAAEAGQQWAVASRIWSSLGQEVKALDATRKTKNPLLIKPLEAKLFAKEGKHDRAAALYEQVAEWDKAIQHWERAERWQEAADVYLKAERYAEADKYATRLASSLDRAKFKVRSQIAQNNLEKARQVAQSEMSLNEAAKFFQEAGLSIESRYFEAHLAEEKGQLYKALGIWNELGDKQEAKRIRTSLPQNRTVASATISLDELYSSLSLEEAMIFLADSMSLHTPSTFLGDQERWMVQSKYLEKEQEAIQLKRQGDFDKAMAIYQNVFLENPHYSKLHYSAFKTLASAGRLQEAQQAIELWCVSYIPQDALSLPTEMLSLLEFSLSGPTPPLEWEQTPQALYNFAVWVHQDTFGQSVTLPGAYHIGALNAVMNGKMSSRASSAYLASLAGHKSAVLHDVNKTKQAGIDLAYNIPWTILSSHVMSSIMWRCLWSMTMKAHEASRSESGSLRRG